MIEKTFAEIRGECAFLYDDNPFRKVEPFFETTDGIVNAMSNGGDGWFFEANDTVLVMEQ